MPRLTTRLLPMLAAVALAACGSVPGRSPQAATDTSTPHDDALAQLQKATPCCSSFSEFDFDRELPAKPHKFAVGPGRPVADFGGTRSYFLAFRLPEQAKAPYQVVLKSELSGRWLHSSYLFAPSVAVLDAQYRPLQVKDVQQCEYIGWSEKTTGAIGSIDIDAPQARYLVVYSSGQQLASSTYWEQSPTTFSAEDPVKMASTGSFQIPHGPNGSIYVGMMTSPYRSAVRDAICGKPKETGHGVLSTLRSVLLPDHGDEVP